MTNAIISRVILEEKEVGSLLFDVLTYVLRFLAAATQEKGLLPPLSLLYCIFSLSRFKTWHLGFVSNIGVCI